MTAPTREEFTGLMVTLDLDVRTEWSVTSAALLAAYDALAAERDEWKRRAEQFERAATYLAEPRP